MCENSRRRPWREPLELCIPRGAGRKRRRTHRNSDFSTPFRKRRHQKKQLNKKKEKNFRTKYLGESEKNREKLPPGKIYLADSQQRAAAAHHHLTLIFFFFLPFVSSLWICSPPPHPIPNRTFGGFLEGISVGQGMVARTSLVFPPWFFFLVPLPPGMGGKHIIVMMLGDAAVFFSSSWIGP